MTLIDADTVFGGETTLFDNTNAYLLWDRLIAEYARDAFKFVFFFGDITRGQRSGFPITWFAGLFQNGTTLSRVRERVDEHLRARPPSCRHPLCHGARRSAFHSFLRQWYGLLHGNDAFLDGVVTRFPARSSSEMMSMMDDAIAYRIKTPHSRPGIALPLLVGEGRIGGEHDAAFLQKFISPLLEEEGYATTLLEQGQGDSAHLTRIVNGQGLLFYTGHGTRRALSSPQVTIGTLQTWSQDRHVSPLWVNVGCNVGEYFFSAHDTTTCFQEELLRTGSAIVSMGSSSPGVASTYVCAIWTRRQYP